MSVRGVLIPVTTPFEDDRIAPDRLVANLERYEAHGLSGYLLLGSTGEAALLDEEEKITLLRAARRAIPSSRKLLAGVGVESTAATIRLARRAADEGADAVLVLTPFYFRARMTVDALVGHYRSVADASPVPVLLYNVPPYTSLVLPVEAVETLATHENITGLKDSSGALEYVRDVLRRVPASFDVLCGSALAFLPSLEAGAVGGILAVADAFPEPAVRVFEERSARIQEELATITRVVLGNHGVPGIKAAMDERGLAGGPPRLPLLPVDEAQRRVIRGEVERFVSSGLGALRL